MRPYLDKYVRGSNGITAIERVKVMKARWDSIGSEFGGRHERYERNYCGNGQNRWTVPDLFRGGRGLPGRRFRPGNCASQAPGRATVHIRCDS